MGAWVMKGWGCGCMGIEGVGVWVHGVMKGWGCGCMG